MSGPTTVTFVGAKGGGGTSTVAALHATQLPGSATPSASAPTMTSTIWPPSWAFPTRPPMTRHGPAGPDTGRAALHRHRGHQRRRRRHRLLHGPRRVGLPRIAQRLPLAAPGAERSSHDDRPDPRHGGTAAPDAPRRRRRAPPPDRGRAAPGPGNRPGCRRRPAHHRPPLRVDLPLATGPPTPGESSGGGCRPRTPTPARSLTLPSPAGAAAPVPRPAGWPTRLRRSTAARVTGVWRQPSRRVWRTRALAWRSPIPFSQVSREVMSARSGGGTSG